MTAIPWAPFAGAACNGEAPCWRICSGCQPQSSINVRAWSEARLIAPVRFPSHVFQGKISPKFAFEPGTPLSLPV